MRAVLSTRIFTTGPIEDAPLHLAREGGFPTLEIFAAPGHFDPFEARTVERLCGRLARNGMRAPFLRLGREAIAGLSNHTWMDRLVDCLQAMQFEAVVADVSSGQADVSDVCAAVQRAGARLLLELPLLEDRPLRSLPPDLGLVWDLAGADLEGEDTRARLQSSLGGTARGRLVAMRAARLEGDKRIPPAREEAELLEEVWRIAAPPALIYDVDDPSGFGSEFEIRETLASLRDFNAGGKRPHDEQGGGLFWAALAPG